ncbi:MAG: biotin--[acetyl-CoA-carboxylase] ligase [Clostridia bacterium]|nr:biotin--[acetyl-CoA-carboxylase] ligase [Clostridia bacterium]
MSTLDTAKIRSLLGFDLDIRAKRITGSTNDDLKTLSAEKRILRPIVLFAEKQTTGRGRQGRSFYSEDGLYMSLLFPTLGEEAAFLTHIAAVAVAEAIREVTKLSARIKWVNDVYLDDKKVCGILTESVLREGRRSYVLGIGINIGTPKGLLPSELLGKIAYFEGDKEALAAAILRGVFRRIEHHDLTRLREDYASLSFLTGKTVRVIQGEKEEAATVTGLSPRLGLYVRYHNGEEQELIAGEVHLKI